jgi:flagellar protein FliS
MSNNIAYLEQKILSSDPVELIQLLYQGAIDAVLKARTFLANGDIAQRSAAISKSMNILAELEGCLNQKDGGEISRNLARLYEYMQIRLLDANMQQADGPLSEVLGLLESLADAWRHVKNPETAPYAEQAEEMPAMTPWTDRFQGSTSGYGSQVWTL